jgi:hypothetical protein
MTGELVGIAAGLVKAAGLVEITDKLLENAGLGANALNDAIPRDIAEAIISERDDSE